MKIFLGTPPLMESLLSGEQALDSNLVLKKTPSFQVLV